MKEHVLRTVKTVRYPGGTLQLRLIKKTEETLWDSGLGGQYWEYLDRDDGRDNWTCMDEVPTDRVTEAQALARLDQYREMMVEDFQEAQAALARRESDPDYNPYDR